MIVYNNNFKEHETIQKDNIQLKGLKENKRNVN